MGYDLCASVSIPPLPPYCVGNPPRQQPPREGDMGFSARQYLSIPPRYRTWDMPPARQYLSIYLSIYLTPPSPPFPPIASVTPHVSNPLARGIWDMSARQYLSILVCSPRYRIWDMPPARQYLSMNLSEPSPPSFPSFASVTSHVSNLLVRGIWDMWGTT